MIMTMILLQDQEVGGLCSPPAIERNSSGAALEDKARGALFQHREDSSSSPDGGSASCLNRSPSEADSGTESVLLGDGIGDLRGFSGLYTDSRREDETVKSENQNFSAAAPNIQVEKQIATNHEIERPPRRKRLPTMIRKGILIEAFSNFPHKGTSRNDEIYINRIEELQSRVLPHLQKVTEFRRLSVGRVDATSKTIGILHLVKAKRKESERAAGHGIARHPWVDFINLKLNKSDLRRCKGRLPTYSRLTASRNVSATPDQHSIQDHNENIPSIAGTVQEITTRQTTGLPARAFFVSAYVQVTTHKDGIRIPRAMVQDDDIITVEDAGEPNIPCDSCKGKGWLVCDFCEGQKVNVQSPRNNRIYRRCPNCKAVGVVICPRCKVFKCVSCPDEKDTGVTL